MGYNVLIQSLFIDCDTFAYMLKAGRDRDEGSCWQVHVTGEHSLSAEGVIDRGSGAEDRQGIRGELLGACSLGFGSWAGSTVSFEDGTEPKCTGSVSAEAKISPDGSGSAGSTSGTDDDSGWERQ
mmetsp:Transcript_60595/g.100615  ORF Transcript_60595/g.100615 Transcript_60595/m.100615 type:complete len:125 (-) Transcript_60595:955-1329(-)